MEKTSTKIEELYSIPCGPMDVSADSVCRRSLRDFMDSLLDRLTREINSHPQKTPSLPKDLEAGEGGTIVAKGAENEESRKERLIREGKLRADVSNEVRKYREQLQGNSKMLQDISGKIEPF